MANTLTGLIPTLYNALDTVSRELIGFIPNVMTDSTADMAAVDQTVRSPIVPQGTLEDITPGASPANSGDVVLGYQDVKISKSKAYPIRWSGEEMLSLTPGGIINTVLADQFAQGFRTLANAVEVDLGAQYAKMSRATGTAGTAPFGTASEMGDMANANRILDENGAPAIGRVMILGSAARAQLETKQSNLFKVNEAGDAGAMIRNRQMRELMGFTMGYSAGVANHVKGTGTAAVTDGALAVGATSIVIKTLTPGATGIKAGDVITFAADTANKYIVTKGVASGAAGTLEIAAPGIKAIVPDANAITVGANFAANMFYHRNALLLATRQPAMPQGGDTADDVTTVTDPVSGLTFQVALYKEYRRIKYEIGLAWGTAAPNGKHGGVLLG